MKSLDALYIEVALDIRYATLDEFSDERLFPSVAEAFLQQRLVLLGERTVIPQRPDNAVCRLVREGGDVQYSALVRHLDNLAPVEFNKEPPWCISSALLDGG